MILVENFILLLLLSASTAEFFNHLDLAVLDLLNSNRVLALDSLLLGITLSAYMLGALLPVVLYLSGHSKRAISVKMYTPQYLLAMCLNVCLIAVLKYTINRPRPFLTHAFIEQLAPADSPSFPSGHTAFAFTAAITLSVMFRHKIVSMFAIVWALSVAYSRMALGVHYPSDVLSSIIIGTTAALLTDYTFGKYQQVIISLLKHTRQWLLPK
jgi:undecaprenyl-diphosphatase